MPRRSRFRRAASRARMSISAVAFFQQAQYSDPSFQSAGSVAREEMADLQAIPCYKNTIGNKGYSG